MSSPFARFAGRFRLGTRGNIAIMGALAMPACIACAGLAVDEGSLYYEKRQLQDVTDIAAIVATMNIDKAELAARTSLKDNTMTLADAKADLSGAIKSGELGDSAYVTVERGNYQADKSIAVAKRFARKGTLYFQASFRKSPVITTIATANADAAAAFSIGSRLASLDGGILNSILGGLTGSSLSLSVMDYNALLSAPADVLSFFDALAGELDIKAGTYNDVLKSSATIGQIASALATVTSDPSANAAITAFAKNVGASNVNVPLSHLFDLGPAGNLQIGEAKSGIAATASLLDMVNAAAMVSDGTHQVALNLGTKVPGVANTTLTLTIGEPPQHSPWFAVGAAGQVVRTAQTRVALNASIGGSGLLSGITIHLPLYLQLAYAEASLQSVSCPTVHLESAVIKIGATPGVADLWLGDPNMSNLADFTSVTTVNKATLVSTGLIKATGLAHLNIGNTSATTLTFSYDDIENHAAKSVSTKNFTGSLTSTLLGQSNLSVQIAGLSLTTPTQFQSALASIIGSVAPAIDSALYNILNLGGVKIGEADVWADGVQCQRSVLVQ